MSTERSDCASSSTATAGPLWGFLWDAEADWLPFLTLITVLVFWQAGLYAERERRGGFGRIVASLTLVAVITMIFALGTGHRFGTYGLAPTAVVLTSICIGLLRGSYDVVTGDLLKLAGVRRRAILVGEGESLARLRRTLGASRGGIDYEFVGAVAISSDGAGLPVLGNLSSLPTVLAQREVDELIVTDSDFSDRELVEIVEQAHRRGVKVRVAPRATELLIERRGEYVPGQGVPLFELRPPVFAGADWVVKRGFDLVVSALIAIVGVPIWVLIGLAIKLDSRGPVLFRDTRVGLNEREFDMLKFRTMRADAEAQQAGLETENEAEGALFKIRDDPRVTRVGRVLRRFSIDEIPAGAERPARRDEPRRPATAPGPRLRAARAVAPEAVPRPPGHDRPLAGRRTLEPQLRRPRATRLLLPRALVDLARHLDPAEDSAGSPGGPRRVLSSQ